MAIPVQTHWPPRGRPIFRHWALKRDLSPNPPLKMEAQMAIPPDDRDRLEIARRRRTKIRT